MELILEKVLERDVDLLIINKFLSDEKFKNYFLNRIDLSGYIVEKVEHSLKDLDGENDITIILSNGKEKIALLIEDKIDAIAMPNQRDRYNVRGIKGVNEKQYDRFFVFIIAPIDYLNSNIEAKKYENKISYEEMIEILNYDFFAKTILQKAIEEKKKGYVVIENKSVTNFWKKYYELIKMSYPKLQINEVHGPRGENAGWPHFKTPVKNITIIHKADRGFVDLTFKGIGEKYNLFIENVKSFIEDDMLIVRTGKSLAIRIIVPQMRFVENFERYIDVLHTSLKNVERLICLLEKININKIMN